MVDFAGWDMPVQYAGLIAEHEAVRSKAGIFDVSHMGEIVVSGSDAAAFLDYVLTNNVARLRQGRSQYTLICNEAGGVIDDAMLYRLAEAEYLLVVNASNVEAAWEWLSSRTGGFNVELENQSEDYCLLAVQGPETEALLDPVSNDDLTALRRTRIRKAAVCGRDVLIGRTGYTGEDGFEIFASREDGPAIWDELLGLEIAPAGLGARNTLRLEAGMALHGNELGVDITPIEVGLGGVVAMDKDDFIGKAALALVSEQGPSRRLRGLQVTGRGIPRDHYPVKTSHGDGAVTSGTFSPTLQGGIGMAFVPPACEPGDSVSVEIRGREWEATLVEMPFYSNVTRWRAKST